MAAPSRGFQRVLRVCFLFFLQAPTHVCPTQLCPALSHPAPTLCCPQLLCLQGVGWFADSLASATSAPTLRSTYVLRGGVGLRTEGSAPAPPPATNSRLGGTPAVGASGGAGARAGAGGASAGAATQAAIDPLASTACSAIADFSMDTVEGDGALGASPVSKAR